MNKKIKDQIKECARIVESMHVNEDAIDFLEMSANVLNRCATLINCDIYDITPDAMTDDLRLDFESLHKYCNMIIFLDI